MIACDTCEICGRREDEDDESTELAWCNYVSGGDDDRIRVCLKCREENERNG